MYRWFILFPSINYYTKGDYTIQKSIPDYALKSQVLKTDFPALERVIRNGKYRNFDNDVMFEHFVQSELKLLSNPETAIFYCEAKKINHASYKRSQRLETRISKIIQKPSLFLTLTFKNEVLETTSEETRRRYVTRFLKDFGVPYVANQDFGSKGGREHYHAILQMESINPLSWQFGALNVKKVRDTNDSLALAKYVSKLTNHAIKESTKRSAIIYSRD